MFSIDHVNGQGNNSRIKDFSFQIEKPVIHALLCPSISFLDELMNILLHDELITSGRILINNLDYFSQMNDREVQFITGDDLLHSNLSILENVFFSDRSLVILNKKRNAERFKKLLEDTGFVLNDKENIENLSGEQRKVIEILKCYYSMPKLVIVREVSNLLTFKNFALFLSVLEKMKQKGVMILYLTSQWEEVVKVADEVTVVAHRQNYGQFSVDEIKRDPSQLYYLIMGGNKFLPNHNDHDKEVEILRMLNSNIQKLSSGYDLQNALQNFAQYLVQNLAATNCVMYLIDEERKSILDIVAQNESDAEVPLMNQESIKAIIDGGRLVYLNRYESNFDVFFNNTHTMKTMMVYPVEMSSDISCLIQMGYKEFYIHNEHDSLVMNWISKEIAIIIENSRLMGRSVLLQESNHRIKNNLQIIISLMEMEKNFLSQKISDQESYATIEEIIDNVVGRVKSISKVQDLLARDKVINNIVDMYVIVNEICHFYHGISKVELDFDKMYIPYSKAVSIALITNELINNSIKHNRERLNQLIISIKCREDRSDKKFRILYKDNGIGFPSGFNAKSQDGVGMRLIQSIIGYEFKGATEFYNLDGACVEISIPTESFLAVQPRLENK